MQSMLRPAFLLAAALTLALVQPLAAQGSDVAGTFFVVTADPRDPRQAPFEQYLVRRPDGQVEYVQLSQAQLRSVGGVAQLDRRRVRLAVTRPSTLPRFGAAIGSAEAPHVVTAIRDIQPLRPEDAPIALRPDAKSTPYVTLLCRFPDFPDVNPGTRADAERGMSTTYPGVAHFFDEVSDGRIDLGAGSRVFGWYTMPKARSFYLPGSQINTSTAATDCAAAADADVNFADYVGVNFIFNTDIGCCAFGGGGGLSLDGGPRGYAMTWLHGDNIFRIGTVKHEMGHSMGLQHSSGPYGLVYDSKWDVMSMVDWYAVPGTPFSTGAHYNAYGKRILGWIPESRQFTVTPGTHTILLESSALPGDNANYLMARIPAPGYAPHEYFTLEARGIAGYDLPLPGAGVVMYRIGGGGATPSNVVDPDGNFEPSDKGAVLEPGEWYLDRANGIRVSVQERVGNAFRVTISLNDFPRVTLGPAPGVDTITAGNTTIIRDSMLVAIGGTGSTATPWTAGVIGTGPLLLTTTGGTGDGWLRWTIDPRSVGSGQYVQTIRVRAGDLAQAEANAGLVVLPAATLTAGLPTGILTDSLIAGSVSTAFVPTRLSGAGAESAPWTLATDAPWITVLTPTGTGRTDLQFRRDGSALAPGRHVARLTFTVTGAANSPVTLVDSLLVLPVPTIAVTARGPGTTIMAQGAVARPDSFFVQLSGGNWGQSALFFGGLSGAQWLGLASPQRAPGSGWFRFTRAPRDLAPGTYPGTWQVRLLASSGILVEVPDTLVVVAAPAALKLSRNSRRDSVVSTFIPVRDSVWVQPEGPNSTGRVWRATTNSNRIFFLGNSLGGMPGEAMGPGWLHLLRNTAITPAAGLYVDTVNVAFVTGTGASAQLVDSLYMFTAPAMSLAATSRRTQLVAGGATSKADSADVVFSGWEAQAVAWTASAKAAWLTLQTPAGTGSGKVRWTRSAAALAAGTYVDTITVTAAASGTPLRFIDTLRVYAPLALASGARPAAVMGAAYDDTLQVSGGPEGARGWSIAAGALPAGLALDAGTGRVTGVAEGAGAFSFTVRVAIGDDAAQGDFTLTVTKPVLAANAVLDDLLGGPALGADQRRFLDLLGNRNGRVDVGDARAWLLENLGASAAAELPRLLRERQQAIVKDGRKP